MKEANVAGATTAWKGAIILAGYPIHVQLKNRVRSNRTGSFVTLAPDGQPIRQQNVDSAGKVVSSEDCSKGWKLGGGKKAKIVELSEEQLEQVLEADVTDQVEPDRFVPFEQVPTELAIKTCDVVPDDDVAGAETPVSILWSGLRANELALVTTVVVSGGKDQLWAFYATSEGLRAALLPFMDEVFETSSWSPEVLEEAEEAFQMFAMKHYDVGDFDHSAYESKFKARREAAVQAAAAGGARPKAKTSAKPKAPQVPDLLAALQAAKSGKAKGKKAPAKKAAKKTSKRKVAA